MWLRAVCGGFRGGADDSKLAAQLAGQKARGDVWPLAQHFSGKWKQKSKETVYIGMPRPHKADYEIQESCSSCQTFVTLPHNKTAHNQTGCCTRQVWFSRQENKTGAWTMHAGTRGRSDRWALLHGELFQGSVSSCGNGVVLFQLSGIIMLQREQLNSLPARVCSEGSEWKEKGRRGSEVSPARHSVCA